MWPVVRSCGTRLACIDFETRGMRHRVLPNEADVTRPTTQRDDKTRHEARIVEKRGEPINLPRVIEEKIRGKTTFCSYELFASEREEVYERFFRETESCAATFYALTWHEEQNSSGKRFIALKCAEKFPGNTLLHCAARGLKYAEVEMIMNRALELGIVNIFALRGDTDSDDGDFKYASDLVTFIREKFGRQFNICVAGYPEMHPKSLTKERDLFFLKNKVEAGADFIITQFFFESQLYIQFVKDCRNIGIIVPIIPGIFPFINAKSLKKMANMCHVNIPKWIENSLEQLKSENEIKQFGIDLSVKLISEIRKTGIFYGYHVFTLNRSFSAVEIHRQLNMIKETDEID